MATLTAGAKAPEIELKTTTGADFKLSEASRRGPVIAAFFKAECPTCQYTLPFLGRLQQAYKGKAEVIGISQNDKATTDQFIRQYGLTLPVALDEVKKYPASNAYGLTNVPSIFLVMPDGNVQQSIVGWDKRAMEELNSVLARSAGSPAPQLFKPGEEVKEFKAG